MKIHSRYIVWIGGVFDESTVLNNKAVSPAANNWQKGLITGLESQGLSVITLSHLYEPIFPKGRFWVSSNDAMLHNSIKGEMISYCNLPILKNIILARAYLNHLDGLCKSIGKPLAIVTYNPYPYCIKIVKYAEQRLQIPTVCIVADGNEKAMKLSKSSTGSVFLSWQSYQDCQRSPKLHLDGGIEKLNCLESQELLPKENHKFNLLYTGVLNQYGGIEFLLEAFKLVQLQNIELWICGPGTNPKIDQAVSQDSRIKFFGLVTEKSLKELYQKADAFINPRPSSLAASKYNFPSKVLHYLSYGKPVISTWTDGLSPNYQDILIVIDEETPLCLANTIETLYTWDVNVYKILREKISLFLTAKLWEQQADKFLKWIEKDVIYLSE